MPNQEADPLQGSCELLILNSCRLACRFTNGNPPLQYSLPTAAERNGDFSALPTVIYDPASTKCVAGVCTRTAFPGNIIPASRISSVSKQLQSYLPATQNGDLQNNFSNAFTAGGTQNMYLGKVDGTINNNQYADRANATVVLDSTPAGTRAYTLAQWQTATTADGDLKERIETAIAAIEEAGDSTSPGDRIRRSTMDCLSSRALAGAWRLARSWLNPGFQPVDDDGSAPRSACSWADGNGGRSWSG